MKPRFGIDLGGTKIEIIALAADGAVLLRQRVPTPAGDYRATLATVARLVRAAEAELGAEGSVGIGIPGSVSPTTGLIRNANSVCLNGQSLQADLEALLERPVALSNDANCFALSEATDGAAKGAASVFGVILGTGTGAGVVIGERLYPGGSGNAGEWGHNPLPWPSRDEVPGPSCWCGQHGCLETYLSGPGLARDHLAHTGQALDAAEIVRRAMAGEAAAELTLRRYENRLARGLAQVINVLDPAVIVLGGGLSNVQRLYRQVPMIWPGYVFSDCVTTDLRAPRFGDSSGVRGAAWLGAQPAGAGDALQVRNGSDL
ncbi:MAG: ROK family protein [Thiotrichales bacterium]